MARKVDKSIKICVICGDRAKGINFNVLTCMSCKAFFRRNALRKKDMKCPFDDTCRINKITRKFCSKCRLKKCFESGMKKEWILSEEEKRLIKDKIIRNKLRKQKIELVKQPQKQNEENAGQSNSSNSSISNNDENLHNVSRKPGPTRSNGRRGRNNGTIKLSTMANQKNNVYKSNRSKKMLMETVSSHYSVENSTTIPPPAADNLQFAENQFPCIPPESSVKYFQPTTSPLSLSTPSSSLSVYHLLTEPSSYGLDTLLSYEETIDVFQYSPTASSSFSTISPFPSKNGTDFSKLKLLTSSFNLRKPSNQIHYQPECENHLNDQQSSNNNNLPQGVSYKVSTFSSLNDPDNGGNDDDILKRAIEQINDDIPKMKDINNHPNSDNNANLGKLSEMSPLNMAQCFNVDLGEKGLDVDPDQSLSFLSDIDDGGLRFSSSSISSSLSDCCFLFSNSIDSIDFFDDDLENLEFNTNNTNANHNNDSISFLDAATAANNGNANRNQSTNMPSMKNVLFPGDDKNDNKGFQNNDHPPLQKSNEFSDQQSIQPSLSNHQSPTFISKTSTNTESVADFEFIKPKYQNVYDLVDDNNNINENVDHQRAKTESNPNVEVFNGDADFSQYLLHDNDPPLTITAKTINNQAKNIAEHSLPPLSLSTKTSHMLNSKDEVDDYCDDVSGLVNDGHVTNLNTGISYLANFDRKIGNLTSNNANGQLQNQQPLLAVKVEPFPPDNLDIDGYNAKNFMSNNTDINYNNDNNDYNDSYCNNHHDYDPTVQMDDQNAFGLFREIHFSNNELMLPERYFILELTNACSILQNPYKRIRFHNFHNNRHKCRLTEFFLHRLIRMPKRINSFNNLLFEDQFKLIKNGIIEIFSLRSVLLYDPDRDALSFLDDKCKISVMVKLELLKPFCIKYGFKRHREFYEKFMHEWKCDNTIFDLMTAIILFTPRQDVERFDIIREEHLRYTKLLKRYLEMKYDGQDAENTFIKLMSLIDEMRLLNEDILRMFKVNAKASKAGPLFVQLLDLNVLQPQPQKQSVKILDNDFIHDEPIETMNMVSIAKNSYNHNHQNIVEIGMKSEHSRLTMMDKSSLVAQDSCVTLETSTTMNTTNNNNNNNNNNNDDDISSSSKTVRATFSNNGCCHDAGLSTATSLFTTNATNHHITNNDNNSARTYLECFLESVQ